MLKKLLIVGAVLASISGAQAAGFGVIGTITPGACTLTLTGGGNSDYGDVSKATVQGYGSFAGINEVYNMGVRTIPLTVSCPSATKIELAFTDNKPAQKLLIDAGDDIIRGGVSDGAGTAAIGAYNLTLQDVLVDTAAPAGYLEAPIGSTAWVTSNNVVNLSGTAKGFIKNVGDAVPAQVTSVTANMQTQLFLSKPYVDASSNVITINGSGTVVLQYL